MVRNFQKETQTEASSIGAMVKRRKENFRQTALRQGKEHFVVAAVKPTIKQNIRQHVEGGFLTMVARPATSLVAHTLTSSGALGMETISLVAENVVSRAARWTKRKKCRKVNAKKIQKQM